MGIQVVKTMSEMIKANRLFYKRIKDAQRRALIRGATANLNRSMTLAKSVDFEGTLFSQISDTKINEYNYHVISSAPHSYSIEEGIAPKGGRISKYESRGLEGNWIGFEEMPKLKKWVIEKLMGLNPEKAEMFLRMGAVRVGDSGFPYNSTGGLHFMAIGAAEGALIVDLEIETSLRGI